MLCQTGVSYDKMSSFRNSKELRISEKALANQPKKGIVFHTTLLPM